MMFYVDINAPYYQIQAWLIAAGKEPSPRVCSEWREQVSSVNRRRWLPSILDASCRGSTKYMWVPYLGGSGTNTHNLILSGTFGLWSSSRCGVIASDFRATKIRDEQQNRLKSTEENPGDTGQDEITIVNKRAINSCQWLNLVLAN